MTQCLCHSPNTVGWWKHK